MLVAGVPIQRERVIGSRHQGIGGSESAEQAVLGSYICSRWLLPAACVQLIGKIKGSDDRANCLFISITGI